MRFFPCFFDFFFFFLIFFFLQNRVVWKCDSQNKPSSEAAKRLGFCFEGLFRNHMITKGRSRDTAWFSITVEEWLDNRRQRFIDYLKDSNFLENGMQLKPLPPIIQSPKSCDVWRQKGVSRFGLHVASKVIFVECSCPKKNRAKTKTKQNADRRLALV